MKYLKRFLKKFNEDKEYITCDELKELVDTYLSYLKDNGFNINIGFSDNKGAISFILTIHKRALPGKMWPNFDFKEISIELIPFIEVLNIKYKISDNIILLPSQKDSFTIDELLDNKVYGLTKCVKITIENGIDDGSFY